MRLTARPPSGWLRTSRWAPCAVLTDWAIDRPRPTPPSGCFVIRRNGSASVGTAPGGTTGPLLAMRSSAPPGYRDGRDADPAARLVVPDRVVDEVPDHALDELLITGRLGRPEVRLDPQPQPGDAGRGQLQGVLGHRREVQQLAARHALVADGQDQQRLDHVLGPVDGPADAGGHVLELAGGAVRLGQDDVDGGAHHGQRGAQLVRGVRDEPALRGERQVESLQHVVEGVGQLLELVLGPGQREPLAQVLVGGAAGGLGDRPHRPQHPAGHVPAQAARGDGHHAQADQGEQSAGSPGRAGARSRRRR